MSRKRVRWVEISTKILGEGRGGDGGCYERGDCGNVERWYALVGTTLG